jgi:copper chaperone CopZ
MMGRGDRVAAITAALVLASPLPTRARAELLEARQIANGMECAECAHNLKVAVSRLDGVRAAETSWNRRMLSVQFVRGSKTTLTDVRSALRRQHFVPGEAQVVIIGRLRRTAGGDLLIDGGPGIRYLLSLGADQDRPAIDQAEVLVTGRVDGESRTPATTGESPRLSVISIARVPPSDKPAPH